MLFIREKTNVGSLGTHRNFFFFFFFFFFFAGGVAMVLQHRYFIQKTLITGTICSHGYGFDIYALITAFRKLFV